jgi:hypothetical protein
VFEEDDRVTWRLLTGFGGVGCVIEPDTDHSRWAGDGCADAHVSGRFKAREDLLVERRGDAGDGVDEEGAGDVIGERAEIAVTILIVDDRNFLSLCAEARKPHRGPFVIRVRA